MKFSERHGFAEIKQTFQIESMNEDLRNSLWNNYYVNIFLRLEGDTFGRNPYYDLEEIIWMHFLKLRIDELPNVVNRTDVFLTLKNIFLHDKWFKIFDFIEFVLKIGMINHLIGDFVDDCNKILKRELSGYRIINNLVCPITNESEINSIIESIHATNSSVNIHFVEAIKKLSDRKSPDYRNSIKESISAVEALVKIITNLPNATLGDGIKKLKQTIQIHPALEKGFLNIYGYTSDGDGIRHAMMEESKLDFEDAKYMLVSCSAFINYLIEKAQKAGIKLN